MSLKISRLLGTVTLALLEIAAPVTALTQPNQRSARAPQTPAAWTATAVADVEVSYRLLRDNHPAMLDERNPGFARQLEGARLDALDLARRVRDAAGYSAALGAFQADLRDGHAGPFDSLPNGSLPRPRWPGFVTAWRGDRLLVYASGLGEPRPGARVLACDGVAITRLIRTDVFRFEGRPDEPGQWWQRAPHVMIDSGNPFVRPPRRCEFQESGRRRTMVLTWRPITTQGETWRKDASSADSLPVGVSQPRPGLYWIAMPTFTPDADDVARYDVLFHALDRDRQALRAARALVLDLRRNQGGWSRWSLRVAQHLWGQATVDQAMDRFDAPQRVRWRATQGNIAALNKMADATLRDGDLEGSRERATTAAALARAAMEGRQSYDEPTTSPVQTTASHEPRPLRAPVYVIVPGQCASSCLDAIDTFTRFPGVKLIGATSSADTNYIDVREQPLPSGLGVVVIPMKMYIDRPRRSGQVYRPQIEMTKLSWSTSAFADAIEDNLRKARRGR